MKLSSRTSIFAVLYFAGSSSLWTAEASNGRRSGIRGALECEVTSIAMDFFTKAPFHAMTCANLESPNEECFVLDFSSNPHKKVHLPTGTRASVRGMVQGPPKTGKCRKLFVTAVDDVVLPPGFGVRNDNAGRRLITHPVYTGERTVMAIVIRFTDPNGRVVGALADDTVRKTYAGTAAHKLFGTNRNPRSESDVTHGDTWRECSYNQLFIKNDADNALSPGYSDDFIGDTADVFYADVPLSCTAGNGHCTRTYDAETKCDPDEYYGWAEYALNYLRSTMLGFDKDVWQHKVLIFDSQPVSCGFVGMGNTGCSTKYCYSFIPHTYADRAQDYTHEMGHNLNLAHAGFDDSSGKTDNTLEYGDLSGAMGFCCNVRCYNAPHAYELGWLIPSLELNDSNFASGTSLSNVTLNSMSLSRNGAITLTGSWATRQTFWLQYKTSNNIDKFLSSSWRNNVQIKKWSQRYSYEKTKDMDIKLTTGQSWLYGDVTVTVDSLNDTMAVLTISRRPVRDCAMDMDCFDGVFCNGLETCDPKTGVCLPGPGDPCTKENEVCNEAKNTCDSVECTANAHCDNGLFCDGVERCVNNRCIASDSRPCTSDCDEAMDTCICKARSNRCRSDVECCSGRCRGYCRSL